MTGFTVISDEVSQELPAVAQFVREMALSGFELRSMFGRAFKDLTARDVAEIGAVAAGEGWRIHGCATPVFKCDLEDAAAIGQHMDLFQRSLEVARQLRCDLLRVFTFLRRPELLTDGVWSRIAGHLGPLAALAQAAGVRLGVENEASCLVGTGDELLRLGEKIDHPAVGWIWDPCNVLYVPPVGAHPPTQEFPALTARLFHIHVKDARLAPGAAVPDAVPVGDGEVGWLEHLGQIRASGYSGLLSLETHWRKIAMDHGLMHLPAGHAFSAGGEEASRICLKRLRELWSASEALA